MKRTFCSVSFLNGRNGESHTTVGIFRFLHSARTFARPSVVQTAGSMSRQRFLSAVVSVIWTTAFDFALISSIILMSRRIRSLFVCTVTPNPRLLIISRQRRIRPSSASQCMYGSHIAPVPIMHFLRLEESFCSKSSGAFRFTSMSSKSWFIW